jgi:GET complex subunit GET2
MRLPHLSSSFQCLQQHAQKHVDRQYSAEVLTVLQSSQPLQGVRMLQHICMTVCEPCFRKSSTDTDMFGNSDPPLPNLSIGLKSFVGEETAMSMPQPSASVSPSAVAPPPLGQHFESTPDPNIWSPEQQRAFLQAIMTGAALPQQPPESLPGLSPIGGEDVDPTLPPMDNPFTTMLFPQPGQGTGAGMGNGMGKAAASDLPPPTRLQRLMPFVHLGMMWCMLAYFIMWEEPRVYEGQKFGEEFGVWRRWAELGTKGPIGSTVHMLQVQIVVRRPFIEQVVGCQ